MPRKTHPDRSRRRQAGRKTPYVATAIVAPIGRFHGKLGFATAEIAAEALDQARTYKISRGTHPDDPHIEKRSYQCDTCGYHHLTSIASWVERTEGDNR